MSAVKLILEMDMNRTERLSAILIHLQTKHVVTAKELASRFDIGIRTVYRDIRALEEAGVPIGSEAGLGYYLAEGYRLPPVTLTTEEACALVTAGKLAEQLTDGTVRSHVRSALYKIKAVLKDDDKDYLENLENKVSVYPDSTCEQQCTGFLALIQSALSEKRVLLLHYRSYRQEDSVRKIEPVSLDYFDYHWHLIAFCRLRNDYRDFRADRIMDLTVTDETFDDQRHPAVYTILRRLFADKNLHTAIIRFHKDTPYGIIKKKCFFGFVSQTEQDDWVEMTLLVDSLDILSEWLRMYTPGAEVLAPLELRQLMKKG
jgi:predicted DNA-binding transcriptional regulator YafY